MTGLAGQLAALRVALRLGVRAAPLALAAVVALAVAAAVVPLAVVWLTKLVLDQLTEPDRTPTDVGWLAAGLGVVGVVGALLPHVAQYRHAELGRRMGLLAQDRLYAAVNAYVGLRRFEDPRFLDRLRLAQQCGQDTPAQIVSCGLGLVRTAITTVGFVGSLVVVNAWIAAVVLVAAAPTLVAELRLAAARSHTATRVGSLERREMFYANLLATVEAAKEVRLFGIGDFLRGRMRHERAAINGLRRATDRRTLAAQGLLALLAAIVAAVGLVWAIGAAARGVLSIGDVSLFIAAVAATQGGVSTLVAGVGLFHEHLLMFGHYRAVTEAEPDLPVAPSPRPVPRLTHGIELRDVWFRYSPNHPWVLRGVNVVIPVGRTVALVGTNGAGKSTLVKLLCRFYDPTAGSIRWDGVDIREFQAADLRDRIAAIFQDYMHYDMSAAENIGLGDLDRADDPARIEAAAARAGIHDAIVALPHGYATMLTRAHYGPSATGDDGVALSGGQRQRVAIARAFLRGNRDLLILDEPSAGLDAEAEYDIHKGLREHRSGRTSLLISHRLSAVRDADLILVLRDGVIVEAGTHRELLRVAGGYARLFHLQADGYQRDPASV